MKMRCTCKAQLIINFIHRTIFFVVVLLKWHAPNEMYVFVISRLEFFYDGTETSYQKGLIEKNIRHNRAIRKQQNHPRKKQIKPDEFVTLSLSSCYFTHWEPWKHFNRLLFYSLVRAWNNRVSSRFYRPSIIIVLMRNHSHKNDSSSHEISQFANVNSGIHYKVSTKPKSVHCAGVTKRHRADKAHIMTTHSSVAHGISQPKQNSSCSQLNLLINKTFPCAA